MRDILSSELAFMYCGEASHMLLRTSIVDLLTDEKYNRNGV